LRDLALAFLENKQALSLKELDVSKCMIEGEHLGEEFLSMLKSDYTTLKVISLRDNFIK
jgi:hypothetical protein